MKFFFASFVTVLVVAVISSVPILFLQLFLWIETKLLIQHVSITHAYQTHLISLVGNLLVDEMKIAPLVLCATSSPVLVLAHLVHLWSFR